MKLFLFQAVAVGLLLTSNSFAGAQDESLSSVSACGDLSAAATDLTGIKVLAGSGNRSPREIEKFLRKDAEKFGWGTPRPLYDKSTSTLDLTRDDQFATNPLFYLQPHIDYRTEFAMFTTATFSSQPEYSCEKTLRCYSATLNEYDQAKAAGADTTKLQQSIKNLDDILRGDDNNENWFRYGAVTGVMHYGGFSWCGTEASTAEKVARDWLSIRAKYRP